MFDLIILDKFMWSAHAIKKSFNSKIISISKTS